MGGLRTSVARVAVPPLVAVLAVLVGVPPAGSADAPKPAAPTGDEFGTAVRPLLAKYCVSCHGSKVAEGDLNLERFATTADIRNDLKPWPAVADMADGGQMPPKKSGGPQPTPDERKRLVGWVRGLLAAEARARAGDPGRVVLRRLTNAECDNTVRDLTGVDLRPARDFPADGAAGEGFANTGDALSMSPTLFGKYLAAAKDVADHAVLTPTGFRFSPSTSQDEWTKEAVAALRQFHARFTPDGSLPLQPHLLATVRHRDDLFAGRITPEAVAATGGLNPGYLRAVWRTLTDPTPSVPLDALRARWRKARPEDVPALTAEVAAWQKALFRYVPIGSYQYGATVRELPNEPTAAASVPFRLKVEPAPGQAEVTLYLSAREVTPGPGGRIVWDRPRFEGAGLPPLLLRDYPGYGGRYEADPRTLFAGTARYLDAAARAAADPETVVDDLAEAAGLDAGLLRAWIDLLALDAGADPDLGTPVPPLDLLTRKVEKVSGRPAVNGWAAADGDLPTVLSNASAQTESIPATVPGHAVVVHPLPNQFVAAVWQSPVAGRVTVAGRVAHAHPACGNGVAWRLEHRRNGRAVAPAAGAVDLGKSDAVPACELNVAPGDLVALVIDPRDGNHVCDTTEIALAVTEADGAKRTWDLAADVADTILAGNPHADRRGHPGVWRFARGPAGSSPAVSAVPADSALGRWRAAAMNPGRRGELPGLAAEVERSLTSPRPTGAKDPNGVLFDALRSPDGPLLRTVDVARLGKVSAVRLGLSASRFNAGPNLVAPTAGVIEVLLPAALLRGREFVVEARLESGTADRAVLVNVSATPPPADSIWDGKAPILATPGGAAFRELLRGLAAFRRVFPASVCFGKIIPDDSGVCLKRFHREDEPLVRMFLDAGQRAELDRLWAELRYVSRSPVVEWENLPQLIEYVTQDQPKEMLAHFRSHKHEFRARADAFLRDEVEPAVPRQLAALADFAGRAYRRPLADAERAELDALYQKLRDKAVSHDEAFRTVLARVLVAPSFLYKVERSAPGEKPGAVSDHELAARLSYFLWASTPDDELLTLAASGRLREPVVLGAQARRMLADPKARGLAVEFAAQWLGVRNIRANREKSETLFPSYDAALRDALFEETVRFCQDLFRRDRPAVELLDADHTFLNEPLAKHYAIPGVAGPEMRRVDGVRKHHRGGVLALGSVLTQQSGAGRTSPTLRGHWVLETLLGDHLPKPLANVPQLPDDEAKADVTVRQLVEKHARLAECATCHVRIDPLGFALEPFDPVGRFRAADLAGRPVDAKAELADGTTFDGPDGLRRYVLGRRADFERRLCRKLLGYALGRSVALSDQPLIDDMQSRLAGEGRLSAAVLAVVRSPQFRNHRGLEATRGE